MSRWTSNCLPISSVFHRKIMPWFFGKRWDNTKKLKIFHSDLFHCLFLYFWVCFDRWRIKSSVDRRRIDSLRRWRENQNITDPLCFDFCSSSVRVCLFLVFVLVEVFPPLVWSVSLWVLDVFVSVWWLKTCFPFSSIHPPILAMSYVVFTLGSQPRRPVMGHHGDGSFVYFTEWYFQSKPRFGKINDVINVNIEP